MGVQDTKGKRLEKTSEGNNTNPNIHTGYGVFHALLPDQDPLGSDCALFIKEPGDPGVRLKQVGAQITN